MFTVEGRISSGNRLRHEFPVVTEAMDFADRLYDEGFYMADVLDADGRLQYYVEDHAYRTADERNARQSAAKVFIKLWPVKLAQDAAYETYAQNISWSKDLDAILSSAPGYLRRAHGA